MVNSPLIGSWHLIFIRPSQQSAEMELQLPGVMKIVVEIAALYSHIYSRWGNFIKQLNHVWVDGDLIDFFSCLFQVSLQVCVIYDHSPKYKGIRPINLPNISHPILQKVDASKMSFTSRSQPFKLLPVLLLPFLMRVPWWPGEIQHVEEIAAVWKISWRMWSRFRCRVCGYGKQQFFNEMGRFHYGILLGGGFKYFLFSSLFGEDSQFD